MQDFIKEHIRGLERRPGEAPQRSSCQEVSRVARVSVAAAAGVRVGDLLCVVDETPAAEVSPSYLQARATERRYSFYSPESGEACYLTASGIDLGLDLRRTPEAVAAGFRPGSSSAQELEILWQAGDWGTLEKLASAAVEADAGSPALVYLGAALCETGRDEEGQKVLNTYLEEHASRWTTDFAAVALFYAARMVYHRDGAAAAADVLRQAYEYSEFDCIADALEKLSGTRPGALRPWLGRSFPDYSLEPLDGASACGSSLAPALALLGAGQVLAVCLLSEYRGNGPYNALMQRYLGLSHHFRGRLSGLHVITTQPEKRSDRPLWFEAERRVLQAGLPVSILLDGGSLTAAVAPSGSPRVYLLDRGGKVLHEGELSGVDLWDALAAS